MKLSQKSTRLPDGQEVKSQNRKATILFFLFNFSFAARLHIILMMAGGLIFNCALAQSRVIKKSEKTETIDGKKFYIHSVEKEQTLYSIAKTYGTTVDVILSNNQDAIEGLRAGDTLKIPFATAEKSKKEIKKKLFTSSKTDTAQKHRSYVDLKIHANDSFSKKDSSYAASETVKPIGDIHVALLLPFSLDMMDTIDTWKIEQGNEKFPEETKIGIEFYEGMIMAFDSLKKTGFKGYIHAYDSNLDSTGFSKLMKKPELKEMDLIIGPFQGKKFEIVLKFSKENNIHLVSPTFQGNNHLLGNSNVSKVTPSYATQVEELAKYVAEKYAGQNIIVFNSANPKDRPYLNTFKRIANPILLKSNADTVKEITFTTLKDFISPPDLIQPGKKKQNIIAVLSNSQPFVTEAVNKLFLEKQENKDSIIVLGMSNFKDMESLDFDYLNSLHAIVTAYTFIDYDNPQTKEFIMKYRAQYKTEPTQYVFSGFDAGYFYLSGLQKYGNLLLQKLPEVKQKGIQTEFNFYKSDINSGYENKGVGIMKFENYSWKRQGY